MQKTLASLTVIVLSFTWSAGARAQAPLMNGLGGPRGYGTDCLPPNDDGSWPADSTGLDLTPAFPTGLHFYAGSYTRGWINNNGNLSFRSGIPTYTPSAFPGAPQPMIAPYWADVDTRDSSTCNDPGYPSGGGYPPGATCMNPSSNGVWWSLTPGQMVITWDQVGYFLCHPTPVMSFQMILTAAGCNPLSPDGGAIGGIDFDIEFRFNQCNWEAGDASGGQGGFCAPGTVGVTCTPAQAGFDSAEVPDMDYWSLPMSRMSGISTELCTQSNLVPAQPGVWKFAVRGGQIQCPNAGKPCNTGMPGICAQGQLQCNVQGMTTCVPTTPAQPSQCNGLDNNCDGMIDNGPCPPGQVCYGSQCVPSCQENGCPPGRTCFQDICVESDCVNVTCPAGQRCSMGMCVDACSGVKCPIGQVCRLGTCVDPCAGLSCGQGQVCDNGMCVPTCPCMMCAAGQTCTMGGLCVDSACATVTCPMGQVCQMGSCIDACTGAVCPAGQMCQTGQCVAAPPPPVDAGMGLVGPDSGVIRGADGGIVTNPDGGGGSDGGAAFGSGASSSGCGCHTTGPGGGRNVAIGLGVAVASLLARRRRRSRDGWR